jgi:hypothetical protein
VRATSIVRPRRRASSTTSTHALTTSCSQRSPSLRPVEPISAMPWPRRRPRLSAHAQACSIDHPLCTHSCAVFSTVPRPKRGCQWRNFLFYFGVAGRPRVVSIPQSPGARQGVRTRVRAYRLVETRERPTMPLDRGTRAGAIRATTQELHQPRFALVNGRGGRGVYMQGPTSPGALANPDHPREMALYSRWSELPSCR